MPTISTKEALRALYKPPKERSLAKELRRLDRHCRRFVELSPFVILGTAGPNGADVSPRGGPPGFVKVVDDAALAIPDFPGNNRLDSLENILDTRKAGLLFLIPGFDETLRVNGSAVLSVAEEDIAACACERRIPKLVVRVAVEAAYLHCAKAFLRSQLWEPRAKVDRAELPTIGKMISDQTGIDVAPESREEMVRRYQPDL